MFVRGENTITTYISDNGPGITRNNLQTEVFRTGNKEISEGILNNVGWGLKASLAWFEESLKQRNLGNQSDWFTLITQTETSDCLRVDGPITGDLPITDDVESDWDVGIQIDILICLKQTTGHECTQHAHEINSMMTCGHPRNHSAQRFSISVSALA